MNLNKHKTLLAAAAGIGLASFAIQWKRRRSLTGQTS